MGLFATVKGLDKCPRCRKAAEWQSKGLWLTYKGREFWIGDYGDIELDENMNGEITAWGLRKANGGCGHITRFEIKDGKLVNQKDEYY